MPVRFDPTEHAKLSPEAKALLPEQLAAEAVQAEALLRLSRYEPPGDLEREQATLAVVLQVNHQITLRSVGTALRSETKGDQSFSYATDPDTGRVAHLDAAAKQIADDLLSAPRPRQPSASGSIRSTW